MIKLIAAVGKNGELGKNGDLIWKLPNDLKFFKEQTVGKIVAMGGKTFNSLPNKLHGRQHYVVSESLLFNKDVSDVRVYYHYMRFVEDINDKAQTQDVYVIGGATIFKVFLQYADEIILTEIQAEDVKADVYFPAFDKTKYDREHIGFGEDNGIKYEHVRYIKKKEQLN